MQPFLHRLSNSVHRAMSLLGLLPTLGEQIMTNKKSSKTTKSTYSPSRAKSFRTKQKGSGVQPRLPYELFNPLGALGSHEVTHIGVLQCTPFRFHPPPSVPQSPVHRPRFKEGNQSQFLNVGARIREGLAGVTIVKSTYKCRGKDDISS